MRRPKSRQRSTQRALKFDSPLTGGAATARGIKYQLDFAIYQALEGMLFVLTSNPTSRPMIRLEPRDFDGATVVRWDIEMWPDNILTEAKCSPSSTDVDEFLVRAAASGPGSRGTFQLVYAEPATGRLGDLQRLLRLADEAGGNHGRFNDGVRASGVGGLEGLIALLGSDPLAILRHVKLLCFPEDVLTRDIELRLSFLAEPNDRPAVRDRLFARFCAASAKRLVVPISEIVAEIARVGIKLRCPSATLPAQLSEVPHAVLFVLQSCSTGLPISVLSGTLGISQAELLDSLGDNLTPGNEVVRGGDVISIGRKLPVALAHHDGSQLLARALQSLVSFVKKNRSNDLGQAQIENAVGLAGVCKESHPGVVAQVYDPLDKILKRTGKKWLVLEVARISIDCARRAPDRGDEQVRGEAKAQICGVSWVYQRLDRLEEADAEAQQSLKLGESIGWDRNTAFCFKCIGRLRRIQAERATTAEERKKLLRESIDYMKKAIVRFTKNTEEFGPNHEEVGDCYSLLGRTYVTAQMISDAEKCANEARKRILSKDSKDYIDLQILMGDIDSAKYKFDDADRHYGAAIGLVGDGDAEKSEIGARAWFQRALNRQKLNRATAVAAMQKAADLWDALGEQYFASLAKWHVHLMSGDVPDGQVAYLEAEPPQVRAETMRLYLANLRGRAKNVVAQRSELTRAAWDRLIEQARHNASIDRRDW